ncbi:hypothetical protein QL285_029173 [Trifolium repens]|nr:hypothetical protein QL285_029173 [Trifolium repens]
MLHLSRRQCVQIDGVPSFAVPCARPSMIDMLTGLPVAIDATTMRADGVPSFAVPCARPSMIDMLTGLPIAIDAHASKAGTRYNKRWIEPYLYNSFSFRRHPPSLIASLDAPNKVKDYLLYELKGP